MKTFLQKIQFDIYLPWFRAWLSRRFLGMNKQATLEDLSVLYKSANFIVVDKHYDVKINSDDAADTVTVATQLAHRFPELVDVRCAHQFRFVHRLDYSTSGALCVAFNKAASAQAAKKFKSHSVTKCYYALVRGHVLADHNVIDRPVCANPTEGYTHMMRIADENDKAFLDSDVKVFSAVTEMIVMVRGLYDSKPATKVLLKPTTGRRHQLRVHCLSLGHPIVGDYTYSFRQDTTPYRMMLHSQHLRIPARMETVDVVAPDPFLPAVDPKWEPLETNVRTAVQTSENDT